MRGHAPPARTYSQIISNSSDDCKKFLLYTLLDLRCGADGSRQAFSTGAPRHTRQALHSGCVSLWPFLSPGRSSCCHRSEDTTVELPVLPDNQAPRTPRATVTNRHPLATERSYRLCGLA